MSRTYVNQGWNRNLLVRLSGGPTPYQIDVYAVARFRFMYAPGARNWTVAETRTWKRRFAGLAYNTWSEKWALLSDISCEPVDTDRWHVRLPTARVRVHAVDVDHPSVPLPPGQRLYAVNVYRPAPGEGRAGQRAHAIETSAATVADAAGSGLPSGTSEAHVYEDALEPGPPMPHEGYRQVAAMHEFGHMLGLMHPNDMENGCTMDRSADLCYGAPYSAESRSIMGRGREVRRQDYTVFAHIMSRLVTEVSWSALFGVYGDSHRLHWMVEGTGSAWCGGRLGAAAGLDLERRGTLTRARPPGPVGIA